MTFTAIHKETGRRVSAYQLEKDLFWKTKQEETFVAEAHDVANWSELAQKGITEVELVFVSSHSRLGELVRAHFRIVTEGAIASAFGESEEHRIAKDTIYQWCQDDKVVLHNFNQMKLSQFDIKDIRLEKGAGHMRADVLVDFAEYDPIMGRGIAFEVQIYPQKKDRTMFRSYDRAAQGYSVVWIWADELPNMKPIFTVETVQECILAGQRQLKSEFDKDLARASAGFDLKKHEIAAQFATITANHHQATIDALLKVQAIADDQVKNLGTAISTAMFDVNAQLHEVKTAKAKMEKVTKTFQEDVEHYKGFLRKLSRDLVESGLKEHVEKEVKEAFSARKELLREMNQKLEEKGRAQIQRTGNDLMVFNAKMQSLLNAKAHEISNAVETLPEHIRNILGLHFQCYDCKEFCPARSELIYFAERGTANYRECVCHRCYSKNTGKAQEVGDGKGQS